MTLFNRKNIAFILLSALLLLASVSHALDYPEARVSGRADDGWTTYDANEQYSSTQSLSYAYQGAYAGYSNFSYGGSTPSLGASAHVTNPTMVNTSVAALAVPYLYFEWRVVKSGANPTDQVPVGVNINYLLQSSTAGVGSVSSDAFFRDDVLGNRWFAPIATPSYPYTPGAYSFSGNAYVNQWYVVYMQLSAHAQTGNIGGVGDIDATFAAELFLPGTLTSEGYQLEFNTVPAPDTPVPEPGTMLLLGFGLAGLAGVRRFRK